MDGLDAFVWRGRPNQFDGAGEIWEYSGDGADNKYWIPAVIQSTGTQTPPNVWPVVGGCTAIWNN